MATREKFRKRRIAERVIKEFCRKCVSLTNHSDTGLAFITCKMCHTPRERHGSD